jgi:hypothetical protein
VHANAFTQSVMRAAYRTRAGHSATAATGARQVNRS